MRDEGEPGMGARSLNWEVVEAAEVAPTTVVETPGEEAVEEG